MAGLTKAERQAKDFLLALDAPVKPLLLARKRLAAKTDKRYKPAHLKRTPEQKKAQTQAARAKRRATHGVMIHLKYPHWNSGINYGPGSVTVDPDMAKGMLEDERRMDYNDARFNGAQAAFIGPQGRAMPVPMAAMDSPMLNVLEAFTIT